MRTLTVMALALVMILGCSDSNPVSWQGQGKDFDTAAQEAAEKAVQSAWFAGTKFPVFKYDDNGVQREGRITVAIVPGGWDWFVAPNQCEYAPAGYCDEKYANHDWAGMRPYPNDHPGIDAPRNDNECWRWPVFKILIGYRPCSPMIPDDCPEGCVYVLGCPIYKYYDPCPANGTPE